jgi:hypothetical protein
MSGLSVGPSRWPWPTEGLLPFVAPIRARWGAYEEAPVGLGRSGLEAATPGLHERPPKKCPR